MSRTVLSRADLLLLTTLVGVCSACFQPYRLPSTYLDLPTAQLTHAAHSTKDVYLSTGRFYAGLRTEIVLVEEECPSTFKVRDNDRAPTRLGQVEHKVGHADPEIKIPAGQLIFIREFSFLAGTSSSSVCGIAIGFIPEQGQRYRYRFRRGTGACRSELITEDGRKVPTTTLRNCEAYRDWWSGKAGETTASAPYGDEPPSHFKESMAERRR